MLFKKIVMGTVLAALLLIAGGSLYAKAKVRETNNQQVILENNFIKATVVPSHGGRIISLVDKKSGLDFTDSTSDLGMFYDFLWQQTFSRGDWRRQAYKYDIFNETGKAYVNLSCTGKTGSLRWVTIKKTYMLKDDSSMLDVHYEYKVNALAMRPVTVCPWFHNGIFVKHQKGEMFLPTSSGIKKIPYDSTALVNESFHYDITDGWLGYLVPAKKAGIVLTMDYKPLMCFYNWQGSIGNSMEWMYHSQKVKNGKSFDVHVTVTPFTGMTGVSGATSGMLGEFAKDKVKIFSAQDKKVKLSILQKKLPALLGRNITSQEIQLAAGKTVAVPFRFTPEGDGTYVITCVVTDESGKKLFCFEKPVKHGKTSIKYVMSEKEKRTGSAQERFGKKILNAEERKDCYAWSDKIPVIGTKWCKPYTGGKIKLLAIIDMRNGREAIEVAGRMDADLSVCTFASAGRCGWNPTWGHAGGKAEINAYLAELLKKNYDCILMGGMQIDSISTENLKVLASKIRGGTGLVTVMPTKIPKQYADIFPATPLLQESYKKVEKKIFKSSKFNFENESFLKAIPLKALPELYFFPYQAKGKTIVSVENNPFLSVGDAAKGRVALFTWLVGRPDNTRHCGLNPYFDKELVYPWHEYFYSMLIKAVRWAAHRSPTIVLEKVQVASNNVTLQIDSKQKQPYKITAKLQLKHNNGKTVVTKDFNFTAKPGQNKINFPVNFPMINGNNFVDVRLITQGMVADFGAGVFNYKAPASIEKISVSDRIFKEGETIPVKVKIRGNAKVSGKLTDNFGRQIDSIKATDSGNGQFILEFPLKHLYGHSAKIGISLKSDNKLLDQKFTEVLLAPKTLANKKWDKFTILMSWPRRAGRGFPLYLHPMRRKSMRDLGITMVMHTGLPVQWGYDTDNYRMTYRQGFSLTLESVARICSKYMKGFPYPTFDFRCDKDRLKKAIAGYTKTRDKKYLHRNPTLEDPVYREKFKKTLTEHIQKLGKWNPKVYDLGDETSYILFAKQVDFDFSPISLKLFREWLKTKYPSLDILNKEWQTSFATWDAVMPDTGAEARKRNVYSSWADHRTYNEKVFADFYAFTKSVIRKVDPNAVIGLSGTQVPRAYGGYDWSRLMSVFDTMNAYNSSGLPEIYRSFKKIPLTGWTGYGVSEDSLWLEIWKNVFNGHYGSALYNEDVILNPDMSLATCGLALKNALEPLRNGIGKLIYNCKNFAPEIALHYSQPSIHAAWIIQDEGRFVKVRVGWLQLLGNLGFNNEFISSKAIENGELLKRKYKALVLPWSMAISDKELTAIKAFIKAGGVIIIDKDAGIRNEHCSKMSQERMQKLLNNKNALYLNQLPDGYVSGQKKSSIRFTVRRFMRQHDIKPAKKMFDKLGKGVEPYFWHLGSKGELAGLLASQNTQASLAHSKGKVFYDVIRGCEIKGDKVKLKACRATVVAALPYHVKAIKAQAERVGDKIEINAGVITDNGQIAEGHVIRFEVINANGKTSDLYSANKLAPQGKASHYFYPALNESGTWKIIVKDVISGKKKTLTIQIRDK